MGNAPSLAVGYCLQGEARTAQPCGVPVSLAILRPLVGHSF